MPIGFFLHIPFPSYEVFRLLPRAWRVEMIEGLLGASLVGFHTHDYTRDFLTSVLRTVGYEHQLGSLTLRERVVKVDTFPMGIDFERFARAAASPETEARVAELRARMHRPEGDLLGGPAGLHQGPDQPAARLRVLSEAQPAVAREGGVRGVGGAVADRGGELPGHETGAGADRGTDRRDVWECPLDAAGLPVSQPGVRGDRGALPALRRRADHAAAGRDEPGRQGVRGVASGPDGGADPE